MKNQIYVETHMRTTHKKTETTQKEIKLYHKKSDSRQSSRVVNCEDGANVWAILLHTEHRPVAHSIFEQETAWIMQERVLEVQDLIFNYPGPRKPNSVEELEMVMRSFIEVLELNADYLVAVRFTPIISHALWEFLLGCTEEKNYSNVCHLNINWR